MRHPARRREAGVAPGRWPWPAEGRRDAVVPDHARTGGV